MITVRGQAAIAFLACLGFADMMAVADPTHRDACEAACLDIFGGTMTIPSGYRLQPEFVDPLRFVRVDADPRKGSGQIYVGRIESLPKEEHSERESDASFERKVRGTLTIEVRTRTFEVLLSNKPVRSVSVLIYDNRHYMRITDKDPDLWKRMLEQCRSCGK